MHGCVYLVIEIPSLKSHPLLYMLTNTHVQGIRHVCGWIIELRALADQK